MNPRIARRVTLALLAASAHAFAQTDAEASRTQLLAQATRARDHDHDHARALALAEQAGAIRMTVTLRQFIAEEHAELGHDADTVIAARACVEQATNDREARGREQALRDCRALERRAAPRVGTVVITVPTPAPEGLRVRLGDRDIAPTLWGTEIPVTPGEQRVDATTATGHFGQSQSVRAGARAEVRVVVTSLVATPPFAERPVATQTVATQTVATQPVATQPSATQPAVTQVDRNASAEHDVAPPAPRVEPRGAGAGPWILGGIGLAALGGAVVTYVLADSARSEAAMYCTENPATLVRDCQDQRGVDAAGRRDTLQIVNNVLLFGGIGIVAGAATWYVIGRVTGERRTARGWDLQVAPTSGGAVVGFSGVM